MTELNPSYMAHWDDKFRSGAWGKYPNEDLVRFVCGNYKKKCPKDPSVLEIGSGTGANLWLLKNEGFKVSGIDSSKTGIEKSRKDLKLTELNYMDLRVGNFSTLPWADESFDLVVDIFALYANMSKEIDQTILEIVRVLRPGGYFFTKLWGQKTLGFGTGTKLEDGTFTDMTVGPCKDMGVAHFFTEIELRERFLSLELIKFSEINRLVGGNIHSQEYVCVYKK
jgi:SAM-dependent methyltransferase